MKRALCIVLDSVGCGHAPDAAAHSDQGANTLGHLFQRIPNLSLPNLAALGLYDLLELPTHIPRHPRSSYARLTQFAPDKDTTTGHWELMGCKMSEPFATFTHFPPTFITQLESIAQVSFIGNYPSSGTEILLHLGEEHLRTGNPILYTSADSVLQIAAHEESFGLHRLLNLCQTARQLLDQHRIRVGRVIARPFIGQSAATFKRTGNRHDYSLVPGETVLNRLQSAGITSHGIGKIADIFANSGISHSHPTTSNTQGMAIIDHLWETQPQNPQFLFANLVDFDSLYGHRRDPEGYAACLSEFDQWLGSFLPKVAPEDFLLITADHGNDPYHPGTDHTREQVPALAIGPPIRHGSFSDLASWLEDYFLPSPHRNKVLLESKPDHTEHSCG